MAEHAFVVGATGYVGHEVVRALRAKSISTTAHIRPDSSTLETWRGRFNQVGAHVDTTPWDLAAMSATLQRIKPDLVFALLGTTRARMKTDPNASYEAIDYGLTALLIDACGKAGITPRIIYLSSIGTHANAKGGYLRARWQAEEKVRQCGLEYVIARPSFITGPDRSEVRLFERSAAWIVDHMPHAWRDRYGSITGPALARALVRLSLEQTAANRVFESSSLR